MWELHFAGMIARDLACVRGKSQLQKGDLWGVGPQPSLTLTESGLMAFEELKQKVPTRKSESIVVGNRISLLFQVLP